MQFAETLHQLWQKYTSVPLEIVFLFHVPSHQEASVELRVDEHPVSLRLQVIIEIHTLREGIRVAQLKYSVNATFLLEDARSVVPLMQLPQRFQQLLPHGKAILGVQYLMSDELWEVADRFLNSWAHFGSMHSPRPRFEKIEPVFCAWRLWVMAHQIPSFESLLRAVKDLLDFVIRRTVLLHEDSWA